MRAGLNAAGGGRGLPLSGDVHCLSGEGQGLPGRGRGLHGEGLPAGAEVPCAGLPGMLQGVKALVLAEGMRLPSFPAPVPFLPFHVFLHVGSAAAVVWIFRRDVIRLLAESGRMLADCLKNIREFSYGYLIRALEDKGSTDCD